MTEESQQVQPRKTKKFYGEIMFDNYETRRTGHIEYTEGDNFIKFTHVDRYYHSYMHTVPKMTRGYIIPLNRLVYIGARHEKPELNRAVQHYSCALIKEA